MEINPSIKQTPYLSNSQHLIDCAFVFGYYNEQKEYFIQNYTNIINEPNASKKQLHLKSILPTVLASIYSPFATSVIQYESTLFALAPTFLPAISKSQDEKAPESSNIVFFRNFYNEHLKQNVVRYGFGYIFYELWGDYYFPKILGFITKYPCFNMLVNLSKNLVSYSKKPTVLIPLEIILYNIVNYMPPPIHSPIKFNLNSKEQDLILLNNNYMMNQISGYPSFDFKISEIFKIMPTHLLIKIMVFSFLEETIIIFSPKLEILNIVLFIISNLSYPLVNTNYLCHIVSGSLSDLKGETTNVILNDSNTKLTGINCNYSECVDDIKEIQKACFIVDLEKGEIKYHSPNQSNINELEAYIDTILADKSTNLSSENAIVEKSIKILNFSLDLLANSYLAKFTNEEQKSKPMFFSDNFTEETYLENKEFMNIFYKFTMTICQAVYSKLKCNFKTDQELSFGNVIKEDTNIPGEECFFNKMKENSKYELFFTNYIQNGKIFDSLKIPYTFTEEFMNYKKLNKNIHFESKFLEIIDYFYYNEKDNEENNNESNITEITFDKLYQYYKQNVEQSEILFLENSSCYNETTSSNEYNFTYNEFDIDLSIVHNYAYLLSNLNENELIEIVPSLSILNKNPFKDIKAIDLCNAIEDFAIKNELTDSQHLIIFSKLNLILSLGNIQTIINNIYSVIQILASLKFGLRKYITLFLELCYSNINNNYERAASVCNELLKVLSVGNVIPNEHLFSIFREFYIKNFTVNATESLLKESQKEEKIYSITVNEFFDKMYSKQERMVFVFGDIGFFDMFFDEVDEDIKKKFITLTFRKNGKKETIGLMSPKKLYDKCKEIYNSYQFGEAKIEKNKKSKKEFMMVIGNLIFFFEYLWEKEYFNFNFLVEYVLNLPD